MKKIAFAFVLAVTLAALAPVTEAAVSHSQVRTVAARTQKTMPKVTTTVVKTIISDDFEQSLMVSWVREMANDSYSGTISTKYAQTGSSSFRIELNKADAIVNGSKRSEIAQRIHEKPLGDHIYTFGMLLPKGGNEDYALDPEGSEIIAQWHNTPDQGEEWTVPPLALRTLNGRYVLERYWDDAVLSTTCDIKQKGNHAVYDLGAYEGDKGKFVTWTFHIKWGWSVSQKPVMEIYKDGVKVLNLINLPNTMNDKIGVYMKLGIYKWDWAQDDAHNWSILNKRVIYYAM